MGNEVYNNIVIRGPEADLDQISGEVGSCGSLTVDRVSRHCLRIGNSIRQRHLWDFMTGMLRSHTSCWIYNYFCEELNGGSGIWIGFYQGEKEVIQSRFWRGPCAEHYNNLDKKRKAEPISPTAAPTLLDSDIVYQNNVNFGGVYASVLTELTRPVWDIEITGFRSDTKCKTLHSPLTDELRIGFREYDGYIENMYSNKNGQGGVWLTWCSNLNETEHHTWQLLSEEEIESFETHGVNLAMTADAHLCADPIEWYWPFGNNHYSERRHGAVHDYAVLPTKSARQD